MDLFDNYNKNAVYVVSPRFHYRPNDNSCVIYPFDAEDSSTWYIMSYVQGIALTLFDGKRTLEEVVALLSDIMLIDIQVANNIVMSIVKHSATYPKEMFLEIYSSKHSAGNFTICDTTKFIKGLKNANDIPVASSSKLNVPISLLLLPSNECETDCIYCYAQRKHVPTDKLLTPQQWCALIDQASELGIDIATFSGGDPLTYPDIDILLERMMLRGFQILLPTKIFISKEMAKRFYDIGMADKAIFQISLDGYSEQVDKLVKRKNYARDAFESIKNLMEYNLFVRTNTVCTPINYLEIPELLRRLYALGVRRSSVTNYSRSYYRPNEALFLSLEQIEWVKNEVKNIKKELNWEELRCNAATRDFSEENSKRDKISIWKTRSHCSGGLSSMTITPDGSVTLCEQVPQEDPFIMGNIKEQNIKEIWDSEQLMQFIYPDRSLFKGNACESCDEFDECHHTYGRCFRDSLFVFDHVFGPPPNCPHAPSSFRLA